MKIYGGVSSIEGSGKVRTYDAGVWLLVTVVETLNADRHDGVEKGYEIDLIDKRRCLIYGCVLRVIHLQ